MTPTWAVILVGLGSAVIGSVLTTLATISHERASEMRAHMLNAADEFSTGAIAALRQLRFTAGEVVKDRRIPLGNERGFRPEIQKHLDEANEAVDDVLSKQARVHLLFGDLSRAGLAAKNTTTYLSSMMMALDHRPDSLRDSEQMSRYSESFTSSEEQHAEFNRAARVAIDQSSWNRFWERLTLRRILREVEPGRARAVPTSVPPRR